ncbi:MAG TPA: nicotinate (nicotinamide) nucleotide adenylyltransferase [Candidatus Aminicenantes bacterium]|nr:nicotinate (nicotinamide) nucleotide adenylyltransferase [Candidatus Aminicenantes bacterium]
MNRSTGIFGGTFNPVHRGHVEIGARLRELLGLDRILYVLSARPPHKRMMRLAPAEIRWQMLTAALAGAPGLEPCDLELRREGPSWTLDTVRSLGQAFPDDRFCFICGSEGFFRLETWRGYRELLAAVPFVVVLRKEGHRERVARLAGRCGVSLVETVPPLPSPPAICPLRVPTATLDLSSTEIRKRRKAGEGVEGMVAGDVQTIMEVSRAYEP